MSVLHVHVIFKHGINQIDSHLVFKFMSAKVYVSKLNLIIAPAVGNEMTVIASQDTVFQVIPNFTGLRFFHMKQSFIIVVHTEVFYF